MAGRCGRLSPLFTFPSSYSRVDTPRIVSFVQSCRFGDWNAFLKSTWQMIFGSSFSCAKSWIMLTSLAQTIASSIEPAFWMKFGIVSVKYAHASSLTCALMRCAAHRRHRLELLMRRILMRSFLKNADSRLPAYSCNLQGYRPDARLRRSAY
jgi:hypothetical protein